MELRRRDFLKAAGLAATGALACDASLPGHGLVAEPVEIQLPGLDRAHDGLRVAQLSDLHLGALTPVELIRRAIDLANRFDPDLVVLTGDYLTRYHVVHRHSDPALIREQMGGLAAPTVATLGNHDWYVDAAAATSALERLGYAVLRNEHTSVTLRGTPFTVVGVGDQTTGHADPARARRGLARGSRLYLAHDPTTVDALSWYREPMLMLAGHHHGGQVNLPPISWMFRYKAGLYRVGEVRLYVNRGIGISWFPARVNAAPEVTLLTLRAAPVLRSATR